MVSWVFKIALRNKVILKEFLLNIKESLKQIISYFAAWNKVDIEKKQLIIIHL